MNHKRGPVLSVKTRLQNKLIWMICAAMAVPTVILGGAIYWIAVQLSPTAAVRAVPHEIVARVVLYVAILFPLCSGVLLYWVFAGTNKLVGPIERLTRELESSVRGERSGPIVLRPGDELLPLAEKINVLLQERERVKQP